MAPRPREFDVDQALEAATETFWSQGYEATSLRDLLGAMGISKSSFYETFGSKHALFLQAIDHYRSTAIADGCAFLDDGAVSPRQSIEQIFQGVVDVAETGQVRGCFIANCLMEVGGSDADAATHLRAGVASVEAAFHRAVVRAQAAGEIPADRDALPLARYLTSSINGLRLVAKSNPAREVLDDIVGVVLSALDG